MVNDLYSYKLTTHAKIQARRRGISSLIIELTIHFGDEYWAGDGAHAYHLSERAIRRAIKRDDLPPSEAHLLRSAMSCSVVASDRCIITVMHAPKTPKHWSLS
jgi:hypothetical protein